MTRSNNVAVEGMNPKLLVTHNLNEVKVRKIMGKLVTVTSSPKALKQMLELQDKGGEIFPILFSPSNFENESISNIHYLMQGPYPNMENVSYLGMLASTYIGDLVIHNKINVLTDAENLLKENHIRYLTGNKNIHLRKDSFHNFNDLVGGNRASSLIAISKNSTSIFEMNEISTEDILKCLESLKVPLLIF